MVTESLQNVFEQGAAVGAGMGLASAYLLSKGLLSSPAAISRAGKAPARRVYTAQPQYERSSDKAMAQLGVVVLVISALLTSVATAAAATLSSESSGRIVGRVARHWYVVATGPGKSPGLFIAATVIALTCLAAGLTVIACKRLHRPLLRRLLVELSYLWDGQPRGMPDIALLYEFAVCAGRVPVASDGSELARRSVVLEVFGVKDGEMRSTPVGQLWPRSGPPDLAGDLPRS